MFTEYYNTILPLPAQRGVHTEMTECPIPVRRQYNIYGVMVTIIETEQGTPSKHKSSELVICSCNSIRTLTFVHTTDCCKKKTTPVAFVEDDISL